VVVLLLGKVVTLERKAKEGRELAYGPGLLLSEKGIK